MIELAQITIFSSNAVMEKYQNQSSRSGYDELRTHRFVYHYTNIIMIEDDFILQVVGTIVTYELVLLQFVPNDRVL